MISIVAGYTLYKYFIGCSGLGNYSGLGYGWKRPVENPVKNVLMADTDSGNIV